MGAIGTSPCVLLRRVSFLRLEPTAFILRYSEIVSGPLKGCKNVRLSPSARTLIWLERDLGEGGLYPGTHQSGFRLMALDLEDCRTTIWTVVDVVRKFEPGNF